MTIAEGKQVMYHGHAIICVFHACADAADVDALLRTPGKIYQLSNHDRR